MGYAFVNVSPRIKKFGDNKVELTFEIRKAPKFSLIALTFLEMLKLMTRLLEESFNL